MSFHTAVLSCLCTTGFQWLDSKIFSKIVTWMKKQKFRKKTREATESLQKVSNLLFRVQNFFLSSLDIVMQVRNSRTVKVERNFVVLVLPGSLRNSLSGP